ncbi:AAA family ATPase [Coraliomargarita akajimensis]|uniref:Putative cytidylate kinase n=1 Tax=Coraliomargarita akajimensis (strain DSM 45221 / IAM 15411 / JCM 23193 / KCTC 12865 / 04OKA010-24) TaxID=583355 RepID=D5EQX9_CORAD|nr:cytidylate kinase-like family protein [Coraliomargarita akajimensis]ADE53972.1 putative cytidylate kinase [Coraliomargarita akajimensis DSM 45221]
MSLPSLLKECGTYIALNLAPRDDASHANRQAPTITISRQSGARGIAICEALHRKLQAHNTDDSLPWTLYDSQLGKKILEDHGLPEYLEKFIPDQAVGEFQSTVNELLGRHPSLYSLFKDTEETIKALASSGHSIIVGRGGNCITAGMSNVLSIRLIGSLQKRHRYLVEKTGSSDETVDKLIKHEDQARSSYVKQHFGKNIDDAYIYDLVINTDHISNEGVAEAIIQALRELS